MQAILTKFLGQTHTKPSRIVAYTSGGHKETFSLTHATGTEEQNHKCAAELLAANMGWSGELIAGSTKEGYCFVFMPGTFQKF